ncbi:MULTISPECIES: cobalt-precorrin-6A reductase [unclassified Roseitalea]|uniref:cobalt-precorrin-6A reductase n=1 Tax=unclassified Roseitalea TaxID=2639107 RepID=UPI00273F516A|nr:MULTISPECIES: cobalt-precorrin-6A reductase [unclassified Roseitalea]
MSGTVLILGGTREAAALAETLTRTHPRSRVITALAGRTREPRPLAGETRIGGFGGAEGLAAYLRAERVTRLIDATHPYAHRISANAEAAAAMTGIELEKRIRPPWRRQPGDTWIDVGSEAEAARAIPAGARVFLALGRQHLAPFARRADVHFVVRMIDPPPAPLPLPRHDLVVGRPGTTAAGEVALLRAHRIDRLVSRNSGGTGAYAKIAAARTLQMPVIMIGR